MIDRIGHALVDWLVSVNVWTAVLLACALLLDRALARRAHASLRIALYAPVALRVLLPFSWSIPVAHAPRVAMLLPLDTLSASAAPAAAPAVPWHGLLAAAYVAVAVFLGLTCARSTAAARARARFGRDGGFAECAVPRPRTSRARADGRGPRLAAHRPARGDDRGFEPERARMRPEARGRPRSARRSVALGCHRGDARRVLAGRAAVARRRARPPSHGARVRRGRAGGRRCGRAPSLRARAPRRGRSRLAGLRRGGSRSTSGRRSARASKRSRCSAPGRARCRGRWSPPPLRRSPHARRRARPRCRNRPGRRAPAAAGTGPDEYGYKYENDTAPRRRRHPRRRRLRPL